MMNILKLTNVKSIKIVIKVDLSDYGNESFDAVLLLGPLYHLTRIEEREACVGEVNCVLKPGGIVDRFFFNPNQVDQDTLLQVFNNGIFNNKSISGFQEGYYPTSKEVINLFNSYGFKDELVRSIRGFGYSREKDIYELKEKNTKMHDTIKKLINKTANNEAILETSGHALYIGRKI